MKKSLLLLLVLVGISACASFESRFTSHVGCPEEEVKVLKRSYNLIGNQGHTVSCRGVVYHCTETVATPAVPSEVRCAREKVRTQKMSKNR